MVFAFIATLALIFAAAACPQNSTLVKYMNAMSLKTVCVDQYENVIIYNSKVWPFNKPVDSLNEGEYRAASIPGVMPQAYINRVQSALACAAAGKRLCTLQEWMSACGGPNSRLYPYGNKYHKGFCNEGRASNPVIDLFGPAARFNSAEMNDPRLDTLPHTVAPVAAFNECVSAYDAYDMHGNLHEWVADTMPNGHGIFKGGFFVDASINGHGCHYATVAHAPQYHDYSIGFRCCADASREPALSPVDSPGAPPSCGCPNDMKVVPQSNGSAICMDQYEAPNKEGGLPLVMYSMIEAEAWCAQRMKRLCYEDEWTQACEGSKKTKYPYGNTPRPGYCNDNKSWKTYNQHILNQYPNGVSTPDVTGFKELMAKINNSKLVDHLESLYQADPSGKLDSTCSDEWGVGDTLGNVEEWTRRRAPGGSLFHGNLKGRYWAERRTCQGNVNVHGDNFRFYEIGFRCCAECAGQ